MTNKNIAVLDCTLGDNAKGSLTHYFSPSFDWCVRHSGSLNCGHVIYRNDKKYVHHLLPSADYRYKHIKSFLSSGMLIDLKALYEEIALFRQDFPEIGKSIFVDIDAFVIKPEHIAYDKEHNKHLQTTGKGVGPASVDKYARTGSRVYNYINDNADIINKLKELGVNFVPLLALRETFEKSKLIFEGSQGALLDLNSGIYPYTTTTDCTVSGIYSAGFHFVKLDKVYGMMKPYLTRSGSGPVFTELNDEDAKVLREKAGEFGSTTGRNRRVGHLDLVMTRYGIQKSGINALIMVKLDIFDGKDTIRVCTDYGKPVHSPSDFVEPTLTYLDLPGWKDSRNVEQIKPFLSYIEGYTKTKIEYVSRGVRPEDIIKL
jgi:adenylosuccinate synthase